MIILTGYADLKLWVSLSCPSDWQKFKSLVMSSVWEDVEHRKLPHSTGESIIWFSHFGEQFDKVKMCTFCSTRLGLCLLNSQMYPRRCVQAFIIALFVRVNKWKQPKCPSVGEWINKWWYIHTMEFYMVDKMQCWMKKQVAEWFVYYDAIYMF